ncbi:MipA/OmpV family protein [Massilia dura]|uniref:MipA/OmpV family protein n=1 Tax=Pseudoduganella dura TaxID=321982 RepID=A0A6I3XGB2_9BURK|nr:MipA/OmpV family protein [Pseudoduganella dura]MUI15924.1 MipA/OmpV family protein [Pseudoduganella dura]GGX94624.1 structural protein MipA [Pseudoduganella dura]
MKRCSFSFIFLLAVASGANAQQSGSPTGATGPSQQAQGPRWGLGIGTAVSSSVYAGEDTRITPFPLVSYQGERFFWRGISGGAHLLQGSGFSLDALLSARMDGIDRDDFARAELAERGVNQALLEDRDDGLDVGLAATWRGAMGELELEIKGDVTGASKGHEAGVKYAYPYQWGKTRISPHVGIAHLSKKLANYYYGTLPEEVARGVVDYKPGSATVPRIGVDVMHPFAGRWAFIGNISYKKLPGKISDSPLVEKDKDGAVSAFIGVSRGF